jgi:hypothetical protein
MKMPYKATSLQDAILTATERADELWTGQALVYERETPEGDWDYLVSDVPLPDAELRYRIQGGHKVK